MTKSASERRDRNNEPRRSERRQQRRRPGTVRRGDTFVSIEVLLLFTLGLVDVAFKSVESSGESGCAADRDEVDASSGTRVAMVVVIGELVAVVGADEENLPRRGYGYFQNVYLDGGAGSGRATTGSSG